jgi:hypothetical protein
MKRTSGVLWGLLLVAGGVLLLLQNLGYLGNVSPYLWTAVLAAAGIAFYVAFFLDRSRWWALIPGTVLLGVAAVTVVSTSNTALAGTLEGVIVLGSVGLAFWLVYLVRRDYWWALIPAGVLTTLAVLAGLEDRTSGVVTGGLFFGGLAITFLLVFLATRMRWALLPAGGLAVFAVLLLIGMGGFFDYIWPIALIAVGVFLLFRVLRPAK